jgi:cytochrome c553
LRRSEALTGPCRPVSRHAHKGRPAEAPRLTDQGAQYLAAQLRAFKSGERRNDIYSRMRNVAAVLSDMEIESLAAFYSTTFAY